MFDRRTLLTTGAAALALPASACRQGPAKSNTRSADTLKIGILTDLSGQYRDNSGPTTVQAYKQAVEDFNNAGGNLKVEIIVADHQQRPDVAVGIVRQWIDQEGVDVIADVNNTAIALAVNGVVQEKDKLHLNTGAASAELTGKACNPNIVHFSPDTYSNGHSTGSALLARGFKDWFLVVADYTFGRTVETEVEGLVKASGGTMRGVARYPFPVTTDYSAYIVQALASKSKVVAFCSAGGDTQNCIKQAYEFGLPQSGAMLAAFFCYLRDVQSLGLEIAQGLYLSETFYWNLNERTRAFTKRFVPKSPTNWPGSGHASAYSGALHYLKAAADMGPAEARKSGRAAVARMKAMPTDDDCFGPGRIREDGRKLCPVHLFQVKTPQESRSEWDLYKLVATTPLETAFRPLNAGGCPMIKA